MRNCLLCLIGTMTLGACEAVSNDDGNRVLSSTRSYEIHSSASTCVEVGGAQVTDGSNVMLWHCLGMNHQRWSITPFSDGSYSVKNLNSSSCMTVTETRPGANVQLQRCTGMKGQRWRFEAVGDSFYIRSALSGLCLDPAGGNPRAGTNLIQWTCLGGSWQRFSVAAFNPQQMPPEISIANDPAVLLKDDHGKPLELENPSAFEDEDGQVALLGQSDWLYRFDTSQASPRGVKQTIDIDFRPLVDMPLPIGISKSNGDAVDIGYGAGKAELIRWKYAHSGGIWPTQMWMFRRVDHRPTDHYAIESVHEKGRCIGVAAGQNTASLVNCRNGDARQVWVVRPTGSSSRHYRLALEADSSKCLAAGDGYRLQSCKTGNPAQPDEQMVFLRLGLWQMVAARHQGSYHMFAAIHYGHFHTVIAHFAPAWSSETDRLRKWRLDKVLLGDIRRPSTASYYDNRMFVDGSTVYLLYSYAPSGLGGDVNIFARSFDPNRVELGANETRLLAPDDDDRAWDGTIRLAEGAFVRKVENRYVLIYATGTFTNTAATPVPDYRIRAAHASTFPSTFERYQTPLLTSSSPACQGRCVGPGIATSIRLGGVDRLIFGAYPTGVTSYQPRNRRVFVANLTVSP